MPQKPDPKRDTESRFFTTGTAALVYLGLAVLYFLPAFLPFQHIYGSDYFAAGYFFHEFISERFAAFDLPKWVPYVYGGLPLFSNPGSTFYPVRWLADLVFPVSKIYPTIYVAQYALAGLGMYLLTVELGVRRWIGFVSGVAFQFTGLAMSFVLAGHDGRIIVATLAPMLFFFLHRGVRTGGVGAFVGAAATVGFALLSFQIQSAYYLLLGGAFWAIFALIQHGVHRDGRGLTARIAMGLTAVAFGFLLAAVNFLPFLDYIERSPRGDAEGRGYEYSVSWSMPPTELSGLAVPEEVGVLEHYRAAQPPAERPNPFKLHTEYVGALVVLMLVLGFGYARRDRRWWFFFGLSLFALSIAFGGFTPLYRLYYEVLPGTKRFRAPSISLLLVSMSLVAMAGLTMEALARRLDEEKSRGRPGERLPSVHLWLGGSLVAATLALLIAAAGGEDTAAQAARTQGYVRFLAFLALTAGVVWAWLRGRLAPTAVALLLAATTLVDLWIVDRQFFQTRPPPSETFAPDGVVRYLSSQPPPYRVWVLPAGGRAAYPREPDLLMRFGIEQAGGEHGNQLQRWNEFVGAGEQTYVDWSNFLTATKFMDAANIRYVVAGVPLQGVPWPVVHAGPVGAVMENPNALPRAWLVSNVVVAPDDRAIETMRSPSFDFRTTALLPEPPEAGLGGGVPQGGAQVVEHAPDRVLVRARTDRRALLVLADNYYPDWQARIDGQPAELLRANHTFRGVVLEPGEHEIEFRFEPTDLYIGFGVHVAGMLLLLLYGGWAVWTHVRGRREKPDRAPAPAAS